MVEPRGVAGQANNKGHVRKQMTPAQIAEAQKLIKKLCAKILNCTK